MFLCREHETLGFLNLQREVKWKAKACEEDWSGGSTSRTFHVLFLLLEHRSICHDRICIGRGM